MAYSTALASDNFFTTLSLVLYTVVLKSGYDYLLRTIFAMQCYV